MNKFALILPLLMLAVFLGYCGSSLPPEWVCVLLIIAIIVVAIAGYLLLLEKQKGGE